MLLKTTLLTSMLLLGVLVIGCNQKVADSEVTFAGLAISKNQCVTQKVLSCSGGTGVAAGGVEIKYQNRSQAVLRNGCGSTQPSTYQLKYSCPNQKILSVCQIPCGGGKTCRTGVCLAKQAATRCLSEFTSVTLPLGVELSSQRTPLTANDLPTLLADGVLFTNSNTENYSYTQTLALGRGKIEYVENDNDQIDYFYHTRFGDLLASYFLQFRTPARSDITDAAGIASSSGTVLDDLQGTTLTVFGRAYSITEATRPTGQGSIKLKLTRGTETMELQDNSILTMGGSQELPLKIDSQTIEGTVVRIGGTDNNSTFNLASIEVYMAAEDDFFVQQGVVLSNTIKNAGEDERILFPGGWDLRFASLDLAAQTGIVKIGKFC